MRAEELINYFRYDYPLPGDRGAPFSVTTDVAQTPWNVETRLLRIGLARLRPQLSPAPTGEPRVPGRRLGIDGRAGQAPLVKTALAMVADNMRPGDHVAIVVYAGAAGIVLEPTSDPREVKAALDNLQAGGSTAGGEGIQLAYATARANFRPDDVNRVLLATDGDFNVGITDRKQLEELIEKERDDGITLTTLGFGAGNLNDAMMESIADKGNGNYAYIDSAMEAHKVLDEELSSTLFTIAKDVKVQVEFNPAEVSQYRLIGYEDRALEEQDFQNDKVDAGDIGAGHQVTAIYEIVPAGAKGWLPDRHFEANRRPDASPRGDLAWVKLRYKLPDDDASRLIERPIPAAQLRAPGLPSGDMAFAVAVAAFRAEAARRSAARQLGLWRDPRDGGSQWGFSQQSYLRQEFLKLVDLAQAQTASRGVMEPRAL